MKNIIIFLALFISSSVFCQIDSITGSRMDWRDIRGTINNNFNYLDSAKTNTTQVQALIDAQRVSATLSTSFSFANKLTDYGRDTVATTKTITINTTGAETGNMIYWYAYGGVITINGGIGDTIITNTAQYCEIIGLYNGYSYIFKSNQP